MLNDWVSLHDDGRSCGHCRGIRLACDPSSSLYPALLCDDDDDSWFPISVPLYPARPWPVAHVPNAAIGNQFVPPHQSRPNRHCCCCCHGYPPQHHSRTVVAAVVRPCPTTACPERWLSSSLWWSPRRYQSSYHRHNGRGEMSRHCDNLPILLSHCDRTVQSPIDFDYNCYYSYSQ